MGTTLVFSLYDLIVPSAFLCTIFFHLSVHHLCCSSMNCLENYISDRTVSAINFSNHNSQLPVYGIVFHVSNIYTVPLENCRGEAHYEVVTESWKTAFLTLFIRRRQEICISFFKMHCKIIFLKFILIIIIPDSHFIIFPGHCINNIWCEIKLFNFFIACFVKWPSNRLHLVTKFIGKGKFFFGNGLFSWGWWKLCSHLFTALLKICLVFYGCFLFMALLTLL